MIINSELNKIFYQSDNSLPCDCEICQNYISKIKNIRPDIDAYFSDMNIDILRPFELVSIDIDNKIEYLQCQYIVFGQCEDDFSVIINGMKFENAISHPSTDIDSEHFVLEFGPIII